MVSFLSQVFCFFILIFIYTNTPLQTYNFNVEQHAELPTVHTPNIPAINKPTNCNVILKKVEEKHKIPKNLLSAIATVETRTRPWTVWVKGKGYYFSSKEEASDFIRYHRNKGTRQMFIGCMQLCMKSHGSKFGSIEDALDPYKNINYAAKLLKKLYKQYGSWEDAVMYYNASSNMEEYKDKVFSICAKKSKCQNFSF